MRRLAIIGSGISGLGAAYELRNDFSITIYEKEKRLGGHTNTVEINDPSGAVSIDTGFIVYNTTTYPLLTSLFDRLGVETTWSNMSFSYQNPKNGFEWAGNNLNSVFGQRSNLFRPRFWSLIADIMRFKKESVSELSSNENNSLGDFLRKRNFGKPFINHYILPMGSSIWSVPEEKMQDFPARTFLQFFMNHGLLGPGDHLKWRTVSGGAKNYIDAILREVTPDLRTGSAVLGISREKEGVYVKTGSDEQLFDVVLVATHANQALNLLESPTVEENRILSPFRYQKNLAVLHTDESVMPNRKRCWASWNYRISKSGEQASVSYYMNFLQKLNSSRDYFLTLNDLSGIDPAKIVYQTWYEHPLFDVKALNAQPELNKLNETGPVYFSGSYFRYGFHEDGLTSSLAAARRIQNANHALRAL